jgi:hypothetical protein
MRDPGRDGAFEVAASVYCMCGLPWPRGRWSTSQSRIGCQTSSGDSRAIHRSMWPKSYSAWSSGSSWTVRFGDVAAAEQREAIVGRRPDAAGGGDVQHRQRDLAEVVVPRHVLLAAPPDGIVEDEAGRLPGRAGDHEVQPLLDRHVHEVDRQLVLPGAGQVVDAAHVEDGPGAEVDRRLQVGEARKNRRVAVGIITRQVAQVVEADEVAVVAGVDQALVERDVVAVLDRVPFVVVGDGAVVHGNPAAHLAPAGRQLGFRVDQRVARGRAAAVAQQVHLVEAVAGQQPDRAGQRHGQPQVLVLLVEAPVGHEGEVGRRGRHQVPGLVDAPDVDARPRPVDGSAEVVGRAGRERARQEHADEILGVAVLEEDRQLRADRHPRPRLAHDTVQPDAILGSRAHPHGPEVVGDARRDFSAIDERDKPDAFPGCGSGTTWSSAGSQPACCRMSAASSAGSADRASVTAVDSGAAARSTLQPAPGIISSSRIPKVSSFFMVTPLDSNPMTHRFRGASGWRASGARRRVTHPPRWLMGERGPRSASTWVGQAGEGAGGRRDLAVRPGQSSTFVGTVGRDSVFNFVFCCRKARYAGLTCPSGDAIVLCMSTR